MGRSSKEAIIEAAEYFLAQKGFIEATITDIAQEAGVHEASVYTNFGNKKNLLFAIYGKYIQNATAALTEHFKGMREPGPKLRKAIWHYLADMKDNPNHARLLMIGQRETPEFYASKYYKYLKEYVSIIANIVPAAQEEGLFRKDVSPRLIRNMALGACVFTVFESVAHDRSYDPDEQSDLIYRLVLNAAGEPPAPRIKNEKNPRKGRTELRRAQITETATRVFSNKGFLGATISEIAKMANLADGTLYEYFDTKEDLLLGIPEVFFQELNSEDNILCPDFHPTEKALRRLIWRWIWLLWSKKDFARVLTLELFRNLKFYSTPGYLSLRDYFEKIVKTVRQGQQEGIFIGEVPFPTYLHMITGTTDQYLVSQFLMGRSPLKIPELNNVVDLLIRAIKAHDHDGV